MRKSLHHFAFIPFYWKTCQLAQHISCLQKPISWNTQKYCLRWRRTIPTNNRSTTIHTCYSLQAQPPVFFVLGGPGSGKGTQCEMLSKTLGLAHIIVGELLRKEALQDTQRGKWIASIIHEGNIVPGYVTLGLLSQAMERERRRGTRAILMDGFPRTLDQAIAFEKEIGCCQAVLYLECSLEVLKRRLLCRGLSSGRKDDIARVIDQRLETFEKKTSQVVEYYRKKGLLRCFSGQGVVKDIYEVISECLLQELRTCGDARWEAQRPLEKL